MVYLLGFTASVLFVGNLNAGWFGPNNPNHYYNIRARAGGGPIISKGEPWENADYTIFIKWPEGVEWKIKKDLVIAIQDTGTLSPDEVKEKEARLHREQLKLEDALAAIFVISEKSHYPHFVPETLAKARTMGASDQTIWNVLIKNSDGTNFETAKAQHASLDEVAQTLKKREDKADNPSIP